MKTKYKIKCWIPVEVEEDEDTIYPSLKEAEADKESMELMQPENIYEIEEIE
jgi:hypothetical protein